MTLIVRSLALLLTLVAAAAAATSADTPDPAQLQLASVHAAVVDMADGRELYMKNADYQVPIASITKVMTALVVVDSGEPLDEWLEVVERQEEAPNNAWTRIRVGSRLPRGELVKIALMASENMAAHVLASHHPGGKQAFIQAMNDKAEALGMTNSHFVDPSGLSPRNRSSAADLVKLVRAAHQRDPIREYTTATFHAARFQGPRYTLRYGNTNPLVRSSRWDVSLSKTGYLTEAGRCLVMVTEVGGRELAMVFLNSFGTRTPLGDAGRVKRWLTEGVSGPVAGAALRYEQREREELATAAAEPANAAK